MSNIPFKISTNKVTRNALLSCYDLMSTYSDLIQMENSDNPNITEENKHSMNSIVETNFHLVKMVFDNDFTITSEEQRYHFSNFLSLSKQYNFTKAITSKQWNNLLNKANNVRKKKYTDHPYLDEVNNIANYFIENALFIAKEKYGVDADCPMKLDFGGGRTCSWGGVDGISIAVRGYVPKAYDIKHNKLPKKYNYHEYRSFKGSISAFKTSDWRLTLLAILSHEFSHFIQYQLYCSDKKTYQYMRKPHGDGFKEIYAYLRSVFVNPCLDVDKFAYRII